MLLPVFQEWDREAELKSRKPGIDGTNSTLFAQVVFITGSENHLLSTCSYKYSKGEIKSESKNVGNQEFMVRAQHRAQK